MSSMMNPNMIMCRPPDRHNSSSMSHSDMSIMMPQRSGHYEIPDFQSTSSRSNSNNKESRLDTNRPWGYSEEEAKKLIQSKSVDDLELLEHKLRQNEINVHAVTTFKESDASLLSFAVFYKNLDAVEMLMKAGADPTWQNSKGSTVIQTVAKDGNTVLGQILIQTEAEDKSVVSRRVNKANNMGKH